MPPPSQPSLVRFAGPLAVILLFFYATFSILIVFPLRYVLIPIANAVCNHPVWAFVIFVLVKLVERLSWDTEAHIPRGPPPAASHTPWDLPFCTLCNRMHAGPCPSYNNLFERTTESSTLPPYAADDTNAQSRGQFTVSAYLLSVDEDAPHIVRVTCKVEPPEDHTYSIHLPDFKPWVKWSSMEWVGISRTRPNGPPLGRNVSMFLDGEGRLNGSKLNRCVLQLTGGRTYQTWAGDILLMREEAPDRYQDVTEEDLAPAIEYLRDYGRPM